MRETSNIMTSIPDVDGDSRESLYDYYMRAETEIQNAVDGMDEQQLSNTDADELTKFYVSKYVLPKLEEDKSRKRTYEKGKSAVKRYESYIPMTIGIPLIPIKGIDQVVSRKGQAYIMSFHFNLENCEMTTRFEVNAEDNIGGTVEQNFEWLEKTIKHKNDYVVDFNKKLEDSVKNYIETVQERIKNETDQVDSALEGLSLDLEKKNEGVPIIDLTIREPIEIEMPKPQEKNLDPTISRKFVDDVVETIDTQGRNFELTPESFAVLGEEALRDHIRSVLNAKFKGKVTGESFVRTGKTDILLQSPKLSGGILSCECKFWDGEQMYQETIDQHFGYLTLRQTYAIQITFSKKKGFTEVCQKAIDATEKHFTYIEYSLEEIDDGHFITKHTFPEDSQKQVEVHHVIYNLHVPKRLN